MPYDGIEEDDVVELPGRTVAEAMAEILEALGCAVEPVVDGGDHGWLFGFSYGGADVRCEVTCGDGLVVQLDDSYNRSRFGRATTPEEDFLEILSRLGVALKADPRFSDVGWFTREELFSGQTGAATPPGVYDPTPRQRAFGSERDYPALEAVEAARARRLARDSMAGPWRRLVARQLDLNIVVGLVFIGLIAGLRYAAPGWPTASNLVLSALLTAPVRGLVAAPLNALFLSRLGVTPGKWLCGLRVTKAGGGVPGYLVALKREALVFVFGCAAYVPFITYGAAVVNGWRDKAVWDERCGLALTMRPNRQGDDLRMWGLSLLMVAMELVLIFGPVDAGGDPVKPLWVMD
jgi:uncharacterized RDD family membrane protein YckC